MSSTNRGLQSVAHESGVTIEQEVYITSDATSSRHGRDEL